jgi:hypothetical protein
LKQAHFLRPLNEGSRTTLDRSPAVARVFRAGVSQGREGSFNGNKPALLKLLDWKRLQADIDVHGNGSCEPDHRGVLSTAARAAHTGTLG